MRTFEIDGKRYTDRQLAEAIRTYVRENGDRPLTDILVQPPRSPVLKAMVLSVRDDPVARYVVKQQLQRGIEGFGSMSAVLDIACFIIDVINKFRSKRG
ncbi:MAG: hypothetical protein WBE26_16040 [Phycisphaerae bacterium]